MAEDWAAVGLTAARRRLKLGLTQKVVSERSGVSEAIIGQIERNERKHRHQSRTLEALSTALDWPPDYLENVLRGRPQQDTAERATAEGTLEARVESLEQTLRKINVVLEERLGNIVDVIYNSDAKVDVTIQIKHARPDR